MQALPSAAQQLPLESTAGLKLHNVQAEPVTLQGKRGLRVTLSAEAKQRPREMPVELLAVVAGSDFTNGVIEAEIAGEPAPDAPEGARGFVGIAFRVRPDLLLEAPAQRGTAAGCWRATSDRATFAAVHPRENGD